MDKVSKKAVKKKVSKFIVDFSKELGVGQYGRVYEAVNSETHEVIAVKIIDKKQLLEDDYGKNALIREIEIMKNLKSPNIIQFVDIQETPNNIYIFQELAPDGNLYHLLKKSSKQSRMDEKSAIHYMVGLLTGFSELIRHGIIHRDIKPSNILMKGNEVKIADFGLSRYSDTLSSMNSSVGTPVYMAPQVLHNCWDECRYSYKCDIWSFGVMCYEMVAGEIPWKNISQAEWKDLYRIMKEQCSSGIRFPNDVAVSDAYLEFIRGCLKFEENERYDWSQIFGHRLFENRFKNLNLKNESALEENYTLTELRMKVHTNNVNVQKFMSKMPEKLTESDLFNLLRILDDHITEQESLKLFKLFGKDSKLISTNNLLENLEKHGIKLKGFKVTDTNITKVQNTIEKIIENIESKNIDLLMLLKKIEETGKTALEKEDFNSFILYILPNATKEEVDELFKYFNYENKQRIKFGVLYERLCKVTQIPAVKDEKINQQYRQMEERKKN